MTLKRKMIMALPSTATLGSLVLGVSAIIVLNERRFMLAALFITIGAILDVLDGQLAQRLNAVTSIGKELDSLADMVTFGVAPAMLIYHMLMLVHVPQMIAILCVLMFVVAGALRLARFNTLPSNRHAYFSGMPIPMATALLLSCSFWQQWTLSIWWIPIVISVSYLMISPFSYPKIVHVLSLPATVWGAVILLMLVSLFWAGWQAVPFSVLMMYTFSGPFFAVKPPQSLADPVTL